MAIIRVLSQVGKPLYLDTTAQWASELEARRRPALRRRSGGFLMERGVLYVICVNTQYTLSSDT